jgi:drug/metabolite transporter (DMT)-like permease
MNQPAKGPEHSFLNGFLFALLAVVLWSGNFIVARALHQSISPVALSFYRWLLATLFLFPFAYSKLKLEWRTAVPHKAYLSITALAGITIFNTLVYVAGRYTTATNMALIGTTASPVFVFLFSALFFKQKLAKAQYAGILLCITGILILLSKGDWDQLQRFHFTAGDLWILGAALSFAIYTLLVKKRPHELPAIVFLFLIFCLGTLFLLPVFLVDLAYAKPMVWTPAITGSLLYLGGGASVIAFLSWNRSIRQLGPAKTALFGNLIPVFSSLEAAWLLNEKPSPVTYFSFGIILAGITIANISMLKPMLFPDRK